MSFKNKWQWILSLVRRFFLYFLTTRPLLDLNVSNKADILQGNSNCLTFAITRIHSLSSFYFFAGIRVSHFFIFLFCALMLCLTLFCVLCPVLSLSLNCPFMLFVFVLCFVSSFASFSQLYIHACFFGFR